jgi:hypothetical protein
MMNPVTPAKAGVQIGGSLDSGVRRNDEVTKYRFTLRLERTRQTKHMLGDVGEDQVG